MVGWHHRLNGHVLEQAPGEGKGQGSPVSCSPWGSQRVRQDWATEHQMNMHTRRCLCRYKCIHIESCIKIYVYILSFLYSPTLTSIHDHWKTIALTRQTFVGKAISLLFNKLSRLVITFLPRSNHLLISWLQWWLILQSTWLSQAGSRYLLEHYSAPVLEGVSEWDKHSN